MSPGRHLPWHLWVYLLPHLSPCKACAPPGQRLSFLSVWCWARSKTSVMRVDQLTERLEGERGVARPVLGKPRDPEWQWHCPLSSVPLAQSLLPMSLIRAQSTESPRRRTAPCSVARAGRSCVYLGRQTSFVTLTYCCQEPKNTFINGKTGMAPQRNILTSSEEPAGRFRA